MAIEPTVAEIPMTIPSKRHISLLKSLLITASPGCVLFFVLCGGCAIFLPSGRFPPVTDRRAQYARKTKLLFYYIYYNTCLSTLRNDFYADDQNKSRLFYFQFIFGNFVVEKQKKRATVFALGSRSVKPFANVCFILSAAKISSALNRLLFCGLCSIMADIR